MIAINSVKLIIIVSLYFLWKLIFRKKLFVFCFSYSCMNNRLTAFFRLPRLLRRVEGIDLDARHSELLILTQYSIIHMIKKPIFEQNTCFNRNLNNENLSKKNYWIKITYMTLLKFKHECIRLYNIRLHIHII